jgi:hypothetical protein
METNNFENKTDALKQMFKWIKDDRSTLLQSYRE